MKLKNTDEWTVGEMRLKKYRFYRERGDKNGSI